MTAPVPDWWGAATPPGWVLEQLDAKATGWRNCGERRWRADLQAVFAPVLLLVVVNAAGTGFVRFAVDPDLDLPGGDASKVDRVFADLQERLDHEALPECVAPGCGEKGAATFTVAELGHLAGRVYVPGDEIRTCWAHGNDIRTAGPGLDNIAEWLRPDAEVRDPHALVSAWHDGFGDDYIRQNYARVPRVLRPVQVEAQQVVRPVPGGDTDA